MSSGFVSMLGHNTWANARLIDVSSALTDEQLDASAVGTFGSIRDTLVHVIDAEEYYLFRITGGRAHPPLEEGEWPGFDALRERNSANGGRFERVTVEDDPARVVRWRTRDGEDASMPVALFLVQTVNHGNEHRSQIATVLTRLGIGPPELSGWLYAIEIGALTGVTA